MVKYLKHFLVLWFLFIRSSSFGHQTLLKARETNLIEMNNFVMNFQSFVRLKLLPASLTHVNLKKLQRFNQSNFLNGINKMRLQFFMSGFQFLKNSVTGQKITENK